MRSWRKAPVSIGFKNKPRKFGDMSQQCNKLQKVVNLKDHFKKRCCLADEQTGGAKGPYLARYLGGS